MYVDTILDNEGRIKSGPPYCGWSGNLRSTKFYPFVAKTYGKDRQYYVLDFGREPEHNQRNRLHLFNLFFGAIYTGQEFGYFVDDERHVFRVKSMTDMLKGMPLD